MHCLCMACRLVFPCSFSFCFGVCFASLTMYVFPLSCVSHVIKLDVHKCMKWSKCPLRHSSLPCVFAPSLTVQGQWLFTRYLTYPLSLWSRCRTEASEVSVLHHKSKGHGEIELILEIWKEINMSLPRNSAWFWTWCSLSFSDSMCSS